MNIYSRYSVLIAEYWYDEPIQNQKVDVFRIIQRSSPLPGKKHEEYYTIWIDLKQTADSILNGMKKQTRNVIKAGYEKEGLIYENCIANDDIIKQLVGDFNKFAAKKGIYKIKPWKLIEYARNGNLDITRVKSSEGNILGWITYYVDGGHASALISHSHYRESEDSNYRNFVAKANRCLDWHNMLKFKEQGFSIYDLGGWYQGKTDTAKLNINRFKESFGGEIVKSYNQEFGITSKGKLFLFFLNAREKFIIFTKKMSTDHQIKLAQTTPTEADKKY